MLKIENNLYPCLFALYWWSDYIFVLFWSEEEARMKIYSVSTRCYYAFGALVSVEHSYKLKGIYFCYLYSVFINWLGEILAFLTAFPSPRIATCAVCGTWLLLMCKQQGLWRYVIQWQILINADIWLFQQLSDYGGR